MSIELLEAAFGDKLNVKKGVKETAHTYDNGDWTCGVIMNAEFQTIKTNITPPVFFEGKSHFDDDKIKEYEANNPSVVDQYKARQSKGIQSRIENNIRKGRVFV